jgi:hypothetical protein
MIGFISAAKVPASLISPKSESSAITDLSFTIPSSSQSPSFAIPYAMYKNFLNPSYPGLISTSNFHSLSGEGLKNLCTTPIGTVASSPAFKTVITPPISNPSSPSEGIEVSLYDVMIVQWVTAVDTDATAEACVFAVCLTAVFLDGQVVSECMVGEVSSCWITNPWRRCFLIIVVCLCRVQEPSPTRRKATRFPNTAPMLSNLRLSLSPNGKGRVKGATHCYAKSRIRNISGLRARAACVCTGANPVT